MKRLFITGFCGAMLAALAYTPALALRPVRAEDLFKIVLLGGAQISPDGRNIAVVRTKLTGPQDTYNSTIVLVDAATGAMRDATRGRHDRGVAWAPDGSGFAFSRRAKKQQPQIYFFNLRTGAITQLTHAKYGAGGAVYSHDGKQIAYTVVATDPSHDAYIDFAQAGFKPTKDQKKSDIHVIEQMHFEANGEGYVYADHPHIWLMSANGSNPKQLTSGEWGEFNYSWAPDDRTIAFNSLRYDTPSLGPDDVYTISSSGGPLHKLDSSQPANDGPTYGHSGNRLLFFSGGVTDPASYQALVSALPDGSDRKTLIGENAYSWGDTLLADMKEGGGLCGPWFEPRDRWFVTNIDGPGYANLRRIDAATGSVSDLTPVRGEAWDCSMSRDGSRVAYLYSDFTHPADVYVVDTSTSAVRQLTHVNDAYLKSVALSVPQPFTVRDPAGFTVQAWFMPATTGTGKRPTLLDIHGGPLTQFGDTFFHEFQYWTSLGYNVVFSDPRGSVGFGYNFEEALVSDYGTPMFEDVQAVMDSAAQRPSVDTSRLAVLGGSYGGYATLWVIAHTDRYKTAIAERVVSNMNTELLVADLASDNALGGKYAWGNPWESGRGLAISPITYVANVHAPLLILHSSEDTRTPIDQTLQEFNALKMLGRTVRYVDVPGENHDLSRTGSPIHRVERLNLLAQWLAQYLR